MTEVHVYEPLRWEAKVGYSVDRTRCRASVHDTFGVGFYQCVRSPAKKVRGFGFCTQHAKMVEERGLWVPKGATR